MFKTTPAEWTLWDSASAHPASTASNPWDRITPRISTIYRSPAGWRSSFLRTRLMARGSSQSLKGAFALGLAPMATARLTAQSARLAREQRQIVQQFIDRFAATIVLEARLWRDGTVVLTNNLPVLPTFQPIRVYSRIRSCDTEPSEPLWRVAPLDNASRSLSFPRPSILTSGSTANKGRFSSSRSSQQHKHQCIADFEFVLAAAAAACRLKEPNMVFVLRKQPAPKGTPAR